MNLSHGNSKKCFIIVPHTVSKKKVILVYNQYRFLVQASEIVGIPHKLPGNARDFVMYSKLHVSALASKATFLQL